MMRMLLVAMPCVLFGMMRSRLLVAAIVMSSLAFIGFARHLKSASAQAQSVPDSANANAVQFSENEILKGGLVKVVLDLQKQITDLRLQQEQQKKEILDLKKDDLIASAYVDTRKFTNGPDSGGAARDTREFGCTTSRMGPGHYTVAFSKPLKVGYRVFALSTNGWTSFTSNHADSVGIVVSNQLGQIDNAGLTIVVFGEVAGK